MDYKEKVIALMNSQELSKEQKEKLENIFPELKESEDEKMRKSIIYALQNGGFYSSDKTDEAIAWLEKQKNTSDKEYVFRPLAGDTIEKAAERAVELDGKVVLAFNGAYIPIGNKTKDEIVAEYNSWLEKQGKQKHFSDFKAEDWYVSKVDGKIHNMTYNPADKIEPKFKVGDFIANDYCSGKVIEITNDAYLLDTGQGIPFSCEHNAHLWTIADARDGDVLVDEDDNICLYREEKDDLYWHSYIYIGCDNCLRGFCGYHNYENTKPATKEQRDTLMKAMTDAGWELDFEKKELKKIPNASEECEIEHIEHGKYYYCIKDYYSGGNKRASKGEVIQALRGMTMMALGVKANEYFIPVKCIVGDRCDWSEEDDKIRKELITHCRNTRCTTEEGAEKIAKWIAWLEKQGHMLDPDKVIEWLNDQACQGWIEDVEVDKFIAKFKKDFEL